MKNKKNVAAEDQEMLARFKNEIKDEARQDKEQKNMAKKAVRVFMTNPKHRLAMSRKLINGSASDLLGYEAAVDHLCSTSI